jgi:hypothetical protein
VLRLPGRELAREVLRDPRIEIYEAGSDDVRAGRIDRRVLATLALLADAGLEPTVTSLHSGHSRLTTSGNVSNHWYGRAVDIVALDGVPVLGNQQPGGLTDRAVRLLLELEGEMRPAELISLFSYGGPSFAMADHADHIHVGFGPRSGGGDAGPLALPPIGSAGGRRLPALLERLGRAEQPRVQAPRR